MAHFAARDVSASVLLRILVNLIYLQAIALIVIINQSNKANITAKYITKQKEKYEWKEKKDLISQSRY